MFLFLAWSWPSGYTDSNKNHNDMHRKEQQRKRHRRFCRLKSCDCGSLFLCGVLLRRRKPVTRCIRKSACMDGQRRLAICCVRIADSNPLGKIPTDMRSCCSCGRLERRHGSWIRIVNRLGRWTRPNLQSSSPHPISFSSLANRLFPVRTL